MKRFIIYTVLLVVSLGVASAAEPTAMERWDAGNRAYIEGNYEGAIEEYQSIVDGGEYSAELYYNLANAYFKVGNVGKAILYYHKVMRVDPSHEDTLHNLAIAEAQTKDKVAEEPEFFLNSWMLSMRNLMSCTAWSVLSLVALGVLIAFVLIFLLASRIVLRKTGFFGAICALVLFISTTAFAISSRNDMLQHDEAIVMASAISVKSSPDNSATDLFVLHEGAKVRLLSEVDEWCEVALADGKKGWTQKSNVEQI